MKEREEKKKKVASDDRRARNIPSKQDKSWVGEQQMQQEQFDRPNSRNGRLKDILEEGYVTDLVLIFEGNMFLLPSCYFYGPDCLFIKNIIVDLS